MKSLRSVASGFLLFYLKFFAKLQLKKIRPLILGVGGSSGKSSVSLLIYSIISARLKTKPSSGKNSETGIPLDILGIGVIDYSIFFWIKTLFLAPLKIITNWEKYDVYVCEMGIDSPYPPKNMSYLLSIVKPKIAVLTNISLEHSLYFDPLVRDLSDSERKEKILDLIASEELLLPRTMKKENFSVLNIDDEKINSIYRGLNSNVLTISRIYPTADFFVSSEETEIGKYKMSFVYKQKTYTIRLRRMLPSHFSIAFLLSLAVSHVLGIPIEESIRELEKKFKLPPGRVSIFKGVKNSIIIDSSYNNATIEPIADLLDLLTKVAGKRRRVGILGDMREQGSLSKIQHEELARKIIENLDIAVLIGANMENFVIPMLDKAKFPYFSYPTFSEAKIKIKDLIKNEDLVLVKSSQNTLFLERVVEILLKDREDSRFLARRGEYWDKIRATTP